MVTITDYQRIRRKEETIWHYSIQKQFVSVKWDYGMDFKMKKS